jgi:Ca-activated chloride channel family protein
MKHAFISLLFIISSTYANAWTWQDLWKTPNQQASQLMLKKQFEQAKQTFQSPEWQATAAFRANDYADASRRFEALHHADGYYNQGNALAHLGQYEQALEAYSNSLALRPKDPDTLHNRAIVEALIKKDQDKQDQDKQNQDKQNQDKQNQDKQDQDKQDQDKQDQDKQNQDKQNQDKQNQDKQDQDKQDQDKQDQDKQDQDKQDQDKQDRDKQDQLQPKKSAPPSTQEQQANKQWLQLIPDDPGGLLQEKFLRDHLRRMNQEAS